jgi:aspartate racemase
MKTLGIVGGIGPESTIQYYRSIITAYRDRTRDNSYSRIINSIDLRRGKKERQSDNENFFP